MTRIRALIEEELPLAEVNAASAREKSLRHGNISTMHLWWARRPLAMSRAVVFSSLMQDPGRANRRVVLDNVAMAAPFEAATASQALNSLRKSIHESWPDTTPRVLDCFAGGGAIPLEAARLGCDVTATDVNPVAYLIQLGVLDYPARFGHLDDRGRRPLIDDFESWAQWVSCEAQKRTRDLYPTSPEGGVPATHIWARTIRCSDPACARVFPIISSRRFVNSTRRNAYVDFEVRDDRVDLIVHAGTPPTGFDLNRGTKTSSGSAVTVTCPACGTSRPDKELRAHARDVGLGYYLYAVQEIRGGDRIYRQPTEADLLAVNAADDLLTELDDYPEGTTAVPDEMLVKSQYRRYPNLTYGIDRWSSMFLPRQRYVLAVLCQTVRAAHSQMLLQGMTSERAKAVATYLAFAVDRIADYNSTFVAWVPTHEQLNHTFPQQSVRMTWDFAEINPFASSVSGNWDGAVKWISKAVEHCCNAAAGSRVRVLRANAQDLPFSDEEFDAVIIDPPYYDAFQYGDLSDYFYVWLKRSVGHLYPDLFLTPLTPKQAEVIENRADKKSAEYISHEEFERRLQRALNEVARVVRDDGIVSIVFAHTDAKAWERLLVALRQAGLVVTTSWPMQSERPRRPTALLSAVLSSSVVLVCRKTARGVIGFYDDVVRELDQRIEERLAAFEEMKLVGADYFVSAIGPAFDVFARYERVERLSGEEVTVDQLMVLARRAVARHAMRRLLGGDSLAALDDRSLFYLTWRWAYNGLSIPADEAYMLCRAFDVELGQLSRTDGLVKKEGSGSDLKYRLLGPVDRTRIELGVSPSLVDIMHLACRLHADGRRNELIELLGTTGAGMEPGFWAMVSAITEALPDGNKERTLLLGLGGGREGLTEAAAKHTGPAEALTFDLDS